jgi:predicted XRE-type DNA-binding protein
LVVGVCRELGVAVEDVRSRRRSRRIREARAAIVRRAVIERGVRQVAVAKALGITPSAVSNLLSR